MHMTRLITVALGVATLVGASDALAARNRDQRHAGHRPHIATATYTTHVKPRARVLRMVDTLPAADGRRFAQVSRRHGLLRGS